MPFSGPIVVGHDGSNFANQALRWALEMAQRAEMPVTIVRAWTMRTAPRPKTQEIGFVPPSADFADAVRQKLTADVAELLAAFPDVDVTLQVDRGQPANVLVDAAEHASLLVVGPRGLGGFKGLVLGSVSEHAVESAPCPVVVVRDEDDPANASPEV